MSETIHVNGTSNSLAHKGCGGFAKNTLPDVCKTPSPGGPIPIPYPVIISRAGDLDKGTKTIKVDGGNMAAIKGSEISRCMGDEPGTAGGVKSSTNMKEATWLLYSFDVKLEGKNACRLSDKLMMNHGNTVCLAGWQAPPVAGAGEIYLECRDHWDPCQKAQMKAKAEALDKLAKHNGSISFVKRPAAIKRMARWFQKQFRNMIGPKVYLDSCADNNRDASGKLKPVDADHVLELQLGGHPAGPLRYLDASVNRSSGAQLSNFNKANPGAKITGVTTKGC
jgi:hypothetical protein